MPTAYADALLRLPHVCVAAVVDGDAERRARAARLLGAESQAATLTELLATGAACAGVLLHGPADQRLADARVAAGHGKHVLLELPPAAGAAQLTALADECAAAGVCLMIGGTLRFLPSQRLLKQRLEAGVLGDLGLLRAHHWCPGAAVDDGADTLGGGLAVPYLDLANWLFGGRPERVYARAAGPDYAQIHLGFRGGMALIDVSAGLPPGDGYRSVTVIGSTGAGYADDHHNRALLFGGGDPAARNPGEGTHDLIGELTEFTAAGAARRAPQVTGADAHAALLVAEAAVASAAAGEVLVLRGDRYE